MSRRPHRWGLVAERIDDDLGCIVERHCVNGCGCSRVAIFGGGFVVGAPIALYGRIGGTDELALDAPECRA